MIFLDRSSCHFGGTGWGWKYLFRNQFPPLEKEERRIWVFW